jgi:hypothetical protein
MADFKADVEIGEGRAANQDDQGHRAFLAANSDAGKEVEEAGDRLSKIVVTRNVTCCIKTEEFGYENMRCGGTTTVGVNRGCYLRQCKLKRERFTKKREGSYSEYPEIFPAPGRMDQCTEAEYLGALFVVQVATLVDKSQKTLDWYNAEEITVKDWLSRPPEPFDQQFERYQIAQYTRSYETKRPRPICHFHRCGNRLNTDSGRKQNEDPFIFHIVRAFVNEAVKCSEIMVSLDKIQNLVEKGAPIQDDLMTEVIEMIDAAIESAVTPHKQMTQRLAEFINRMHQSKSSSANNFVKELHKRVEAGALADLSAGVDPVDVVATRQTSSRKRARSEKYVKQEKAAGYIGTSLTRSSWDTLTDDAKVDMYVSASASFQAKLLATVETFLYEQKLEDGTTTLTNGKALLLDFMKKYTWVVQNVSAQEWKDSEDASKVDLYRIATLLRQRDILRDKLNTITVDTIINGNPGTMTAAQQLDQLLVAGQ